MSRTAPSHLLHPYMDETGMGDISLIKMGDKETEAQRGEMTCPRSHSEQSQVLCPVCIPITLPSKKTSGLFQELKMRREKLFKKQDSPTFPVIECKYSK